MGHHTVRKIVSTNSLVEYIRNQSDVNGTLPHATFHSIVPIFADGSSDC